MTAPHAVASAGSGVIDARGAAALHQRLAVDDDRLDVIAAAAALNTRRLHSAIGYVTPHDGLAGRHTEIWEERDRKLEAARARRAARREEGLCLATPDPIRA